MVSLWMVTGILLYLAFIRLLHSDYHIEGGAMLLTASIAVCANLLYVPVEQAPCGTQGEGGFSRVGEPALSPRNRHAHAHTVLTRRLPWGRLRTDGGESRNPESADIYQGPTVYQPPCRGLSSALSHLSPPTTPVR